MVTPGRFRAHAAVVLLLTLVSTATAKYSGGSGTAQDPYQIATAANLILLGETPADYDQHFILTADLDLDPKLPGRKVFDKAVFAPAKTNYFEGTSFTGVFDGNGHRVSHLTIAGKGYLGLFGQLASGAEVKNLGVVDVNVTGAGSCIGGLVGWNMSGDVTQCYSTGVVSGTGGGVGGLVGMNSGHIIRCYSTGAVIGTSLVGGLVGHNPDGIVTHCYSTGAVSGASGVGGLVGYNGGAVTQCYSTGAVSGTGQYGSVGGLVGDSWSPGSVLHSVWDIQTSGLSGSTGGVGLTPVEMMDPYMLGLNGFANDPSWVLNAGHDYPRLAWEGKPGNIIPEPHIDWLAGGGTSASAYQVDDAAQLITLGRASVLWDKHFVLGADINLDPKLPNGRVFAQAVIPVLAGVFDGNGHTISHLAIRGGSCLGLFGQLASGAEVKNLGVVDVNIAGSGAAVGALLGVIDEGAVTRCYSTGAVTGGYDVGGLVGSNGFSYYVDDLLVWDGGIVTQCYSTAKVSGTGCVGGLVAENWGCVTECYSTSAVRGDGNDIGGLVGENYGAVTQCYSTGAVSGTSCVGGLVGANLSSTPGLWVKDGTLTQCYSTGAVSGTGWGVGGLVGCKDYYYSSSVTGCFWDTQTSGQAKSAGGTGKTTAEMQTAKTFLDAGWDFAGETANGTEDLWWILEGKDYPRLLWEAAKK
jgi:hypothetical protein